MTTNITHTRTVFVHDALVHIVLWVRCSCCCCCTTFLRLFYIISYKLQVVALILVLLNLYESIIIMWPICERGKWSELCALARLLARPHLSILCTFYRLKSICVKQFVWWQSIQYWQVRHCRWTCSIRNIASVRNWFTHIHTLYTSTYVPYNICMRIAF